MTLEEKRKRLEAIFELQKQFILNLSFENYFDTLLKVRQLELQKEMIKSIPTTKIEFGVTAKEFSSQIISFGQQISKSERINFHHTIPLEKPTVIGGFFDYGDFAEIRINNQ